MMAPERPGGPGAAVCPSPMALALPPLLAPAAGAGAGAGAGRAGHPRGGGGAATAAASPSAAAAPSSAPAPADASPPTFPRLMGPIAQIKEGDAAGGVAAGAVLASTPGAGRLGAGDGGVGAAGATEDDDLTSLTWLQDRNLLRGMKLTPPMGEAQESPTSDYGDEEDEDEDEDEDEEEDLGGGSVSGGGGGRARTGPRARATARIVGSSPAGSGSDSGSSANASPAPTARAAPPPAPAPSAPASGRHKHPLNVPYDPLVHVNSKPPYSFSCLIFMAIEDSLQRALPVKEIYLWILEHFPYFKNAPTGWKNSVRHNLSLNKCFRKVEKAPNLGKGSLWMVDPMFRPNLLAALQKAPFHPQSNLERIAAITNSTLNGGSVASRTANGGGGGGGGGAPGLPETPTGRPAAGRRLPDPELFPFLSRRLAASGVDIVPVAEESESSGGGGGGGGTTAEGAAAAATTAVDDVESLDDVDAAAAMLALKHGPLMLITRNDVFRPFQGQNGVDSKFKKKNRASKTPDTTGEGIYPVITTSPSEDHTYSAGPTVPPSSSPDEAYGEGSASEDSSLHSFHPPPPKMFIGDSPLVLRCTPRSSLADTDAEEQRKIAEGADALLNLAGITTRKRSHSDDFHTVVPAAATAAVVPVALPVALPVASPSSSTSSAASSPLPPPDEKDDVEREEDEEDEEEADNVPSPPPPPRRAIVTRGRKRGGVVHSNGTASAAGGGRPKLPWSAASGAGRRRRGVGDGRRGGRRRGGATTNPGNSHVHPKSKLGSTSGAHGVRGDQESRRAFRSEEKTNRSRR